MGSVIQSNEGTTDTVPTKLNAKACSKVSGALVKHKIGPDGLAPWPKTTWARLSKMESEPDGIARASYTLTLGKKGTMHNMCDELQQQHIKRGRMEIEEANSDEISAEVESHPC